VRFIPTCVGNIDRICQPLHLLLGSSPRVWGTCKRVTIVSMAGFGSSPRVWGTCGGGGGRITLGRFIPTCVGNIRPVARRWAMGAVHPHVCGEHEEIRISVIGYPGSSPRVWGTCHWQPADCGAQRFIPTCVGNMHAPLQTSFLQTRFIPTCVGNMKLVNTS